MIPNHAEYMKYSGNRVSYFVEEIDGSTYIEEFIVNDSNMLEFIIHNQPKLTQCELPSEFQETDDWFSFEVDCGGNDVCYFLMENLFMKNVLWEEIDDYTDDTIISICVPHSKDF